MEIKTEEFEIKAHRGSTCVVFPASGVQAETLATDHGVWAAAGVEPVA